MANVFGTVIDDAYVRKLPDYLHKDVITREDRAAVALKQQYTRGYDADAINYVKQLNSETDVKICTLVVFYNATGNPIEYTNDHSWYGKLGKAPYPARIENGQWAGFLHQKVAYHTSGSNGAVVYHCTDTLNETSDVMIAWDTPWGPAGNKAYTEIREKNHFDDSEDRWGVVNDKMYRGHYNSEDVRNGVKSKVATSSGDTPEYVATFYLA